MIGPPLAIRMLHATRWRLPTPFVMLISPTGYCTNDFVTPIALNDARFVVDPDIRTGIVGRNTLRAPSWNRLDLSLTKAIGMPFTPWEGDKFEIRVDFFNVFNRPIFTWDAASVGGFSDGDVFNTFFNQPELNGGPNNTLRTPVRDEFNCAIRSEIKTVNDTRNFRGGTFGPALFYATNRVKLTSLQTCLVSSLLS